MYFLQIYDFVLVEIKLDNKSVYVCVSSKRPVTFALLDLDTNIFFLYRKVTTMRWNTILNALSNLFNRCCKLPFKIVHAKLTNLFLKCNVLIKDKSWSVSSPQVVTWFTFTEEKWYVIKWENNICKCAYDFDFDRDEKFYADAVGATRRIKWCYWWCSLCEFHYLVQLCLSMILIANKLFIALCHKQLTITLWVYNGHMYELT